MVGVIVAFAVWQRSPVPAWLAEQTARRYLERSAPEYDIVQVVEGENWQDAMPYYLPPLGIKYHSYLAIGKTDEGNDDQYIRLELGWGPFPVTVVKAEERKDGKIEAYYP